MSEMGVDIETLKVSKERRENFGGESVHR